MGGALEFEWDSEDLKVFRGGAVEKALARALRLAGNAAIREAKEASTDHVTSRKLIGRSNVEEGLPLDMPKTSDAINDLVWVERISGKGMALSKFPNIQTALGATVRVNAASGFKLLKGAFTVRLSSGHLGIFRRKGAERLPIKELWTTRISDAMSDPGAIDGAHRKAQEKFQTVFARGIERELAKLKRKGDA